MEIGSWLVAERLGIPHATVQVTAWRPPFGASWPMPSIHCACEHGLPPDATERLLGACFFTTRPPVHARPGGATPRADRRAPAHRRRPGRSPAADAAADADVAGSVRASGPTVGPRVAHHARAPSSPTDTPCCGRSSTARSRPGPGRGRPGQRPGGVRPGARGRGGPSLDPDVGAAAAGGHRRVPRRIRHPDRGACRRSADAHHAARRGPARQRRATSIAPVWPGRSRRTTLTPALVATPSFGSRRPDLRRTAAVVAAEVAAMPGPDVAVERLEAIVSAAGTR